MNAHASATATPPSFTQATNDACRTLTGKHPADLLCLLTELHGAFKELDALLYTIASAAQDTDTPMASLQRIHGLAGLGARVAADMASYADCEHDDMRNNLLEAGEREASA